MKINTLKPVSFELPDLVQRVLKLTPGTVIEREHIIFLQGWLDAVRFYNCYHYLKRYDDEKQIEEFIELYEKHGESIFQIE